MAAGRSGEWRGVGSSVGLKMAGVGDVYHQEKSEEKFNFFLPSLGPWDCFCYHQTEEKKRRKKELGFKSVETWV